MVGREQVTNLLVDVTQGDDQAVRVLFPMIYDELRSLAHRRLLAERADHTLDTTALVHEVFLQMVDQTKIGWRDQAHFYALCARAMRHILVDYARKRSAKKRGGAQRSLPLDENRVAAHERDALLVKLDGALELLAQRSPELVGVVECRFFGGMSVQETAEALGTSQRTVERSWARARAYLYRSLNRDELGVL